MAPVLAAEKASWAPAAGESLLEPLRALFEPIMLQSDQICDGIGYPVELRLGRHETVVLDFPKRAVREPIPDEKFRYGFEIAPELVRTVLRDDEPDWVNTIFLSTRFRAWRVGGYNEYLYTFFKCLTDERIAYADGWFAEAHDDTASITLDGWEIQRRCPHLKADLSKFGVVEGSTLTCNLHGWQWNLENGRCLTTKGHELRSAGMTAPRQYYDDGLIQLDREAITLRRYHFPSGTSKIIPLRSIRGYKAESLGLFTERFRHLGQLGPAPLAAAGHLAADQVDAGDARRARRAARAGVHAAAAEGVPGRARRAARQLSTFAVQHLGSDERHQGLRHTDAAVGLLVVLQDRHQPPGGRQRAVKRRGGLRLAVLVAVANRQPAGLKGGAVRSRRQLAVGLLRRNPRLAVELACRRRAQIACGDVDHAIGHLDLRQHLALPTQQPLVFGLGLVRLAVDEALDLVELVHADDAAGVLAVAAGLAAEARRPARVAQRPAGQVEDFVGVIAGQRHLGGADEVEVVGLEPVDLLGVRAEEPGARHHSGRTSTGGIISVNPFSSPAAPRAASARAAAARPRR